MSADVLDVARYILKKQGRMTAMKLQKLCYYAQAWSLVWDEQPLFPERIEAWANGPVIPRLYQAHRGAFRLTFKDIKGNTRRLSATQQETVDAVLDFYGKKSSHVLSQLTHREDPWQNARRGLKPGERGNKTIAHAAMSEYYGALVE